MSRWMLGAVLGALAGAIDVTPMLLRRAELHTSANAFLHWVVVGVLTAYTPFPMAPWLNGLVIAWLTALPVVAERAAQRPSSALGIVALSSVLGAALGALTGRWLR